MAMCGMRMLNFCFRLRSAAVFCLAVVFTGPAQDFRMATSPNQLNYQVQQTRKSAADVRGVPSVDQSVYILGPGDAIEIRSSKMPWAVYSGTVNESNVLYVPELGTFDVNKRSLETAKKEITKYLMQQSPRDEIDMTLSSPKQVEVVVTGDAVNSGSYRLSGALRVLDAIKLALQDSMSLFKDINFRNVAVTIKGKVLFYDLAGFISNGDGLENPYLYPGEIISVTSAAKWVTVSGAVSGSFPESVPLRENDTYGQIFKLYKMAEDADTTNILIYRAGQPVKRYTQSMVSGEIVNNGDYVIVAPLKPPKKLIQVSIKGEISNPGTYPIESGTVFSARDVVTVSGGTLENADSNRIYIIRKDPLVALSSRIGKDPTYLSQKKDQISQRMISSGDYRIIPLRTASVVTLENNDVIIVPEVSHSVFISGNVKKPGAYPYVSGKSVRYYIDNAGGWTKKADRRNFSIVTAYNDYWVVKTTPIEAGDLIIVPDRPQNERMQRYDLFIKTLYYLAITVTAGVTAAKALDFIQDE